MCVKHTRHQIIVNVTLLASKEFNTCQTILSALWATRDRGWHMHSIHIGLCTRMWRPYFSCRYGGLRTPTKGRTYVAVVLLVPKPSEENGSSKEQSANGCPVVVPERGVHSWKNWGSGGTMHCRDQGKQRSPKGSIWGRWRCGDALLHIPDTEPWETWAAAPDKSLDTRFAIRAWLCQCKFLIPSPPCCLGMVTTSQDTRQWQPWTSLRFFQKKASLSLSTASILALFHCMQAISKLGMAVNTASIIIFRPPTENSWYPTWPSTINFLNNWLQPCSGDCVHR